VYYIQQAKTEVVNWRKFVIEWVTERKKMESWEGKYEQNTQHNKV